MAKTVRRARLLEKKEIRNLFSMDEHSAMNSHRKWMANGQPPVNGDSNEHPNGHCLGHQTKWIANDQKTIGQFG
jgi:hypothetical protein